MPAKSPAGKPAEEPNESVEPAEDATAEEPQYANRAERRAAKGKGAPGQQQTFGKGKVSAKGNSGPSQRIWSNRKAG